MNKKILFNLGFLFLVFIVSEFFYVYAQQGDAIPNRPQLNYTSEDARDPFDTYLPGQEKTNYDQEEYTSGSVQPPSLTVQGLIWGGSIPQAIVNNKVVKVGDVIEEARIADITKEGVKVSYKGRNFNLAPATLSSSQEVGE